MDLHIALEGRKDLSGQIYRQLRAAILAGRIVAGEQLPPSRYLAERLDVSRKTIAEAYERLASEGYLAGRIGKGTFVADYTAQPPQKNGAHGTRSAVYPRRIWEGMPEALVLPTTQASLRYDFIGGATDKRRFPFAAWRSCLQLALRSQARGQGVYGDPAGYIDLRHAICRYLAFSRAVACGWEDVLVTNGAQQALDLLGRAVLEPGDVVAVEEPGYPPARASFELLGARVVGVPVDRNGIRVELLPDAARAVYVTPSHQFPLGMPLSLSRRMELLEWAERRGSLIIEDDYDGEFRFEGRPLESLQNLDRAGLVAYVGTFSKTIFPELRIGFVVCPPVLHDALMKAKQLSDRHNSTLEQIALARFISSGEFAKHTRRIHKEYAARRKRILERLEREFGEWLTPIAPAAGIHLTARFNHLIDEANLMSEARIHDLGIYPISRFFSDTAPQAGLLFGYGCIELPDIDTGLDRLLQILTGIGAGKVS